MPAENLTRAEAAERAALVHVGSYDVALDLTGTRDTFTSRPAGALGGAQRARSGPR